MFYPDWDKNHESTGLTYSETWRNIHNPFENAEPEIIATADLDSMLSVEEPCEYCKDGFDFFNRVISPSCRASGTTSGIFIRQKEDKTHLILSVQSYLHGERKEVEISYCPWCGRKL